MFTFVSRLHRFEVITYFVSIQIGDTRCRCGEKQFVADGDFGCFDGKFRHAQFREILYAFAHIYLFLGGAASVVLVPFSQFLPLVVTIPEPAVEDGGETLIPSVLFLFGKGAIQYGGDSLLIAGHHGVYILWASCTSFNLEHPHAGLHHLVDETHRLEVFWTHDILVVYFQL